MKPKRQLTGLWRYTGIAPAALLGLFILWSAVARVPRFAVISTYLGVTLALIILYYPALERSPKHRPTAVDFVVIAAAAAPTLYYLFNYDSIINSMGIARPIYMVLGASISIAAVEACRRALGWTLPVLAVIFFVYAVFGQQMPGMLEHGGISLRRMLDSLYGFEGMYGVVARTYATFVIPFIILGAVMEKMGTGQAFIRFALRAVGRHVGGAAKASVISSGLAGSIVGAGAGNITLTGTFTIPLMKRSGTPAHTAGAIETVASIGGHMVPPVMGAAAFVMASITGISYAEIVLVSIAPALLLYIALYTQVHLEAKKGNWTPVMEDETSAVTERHTLMRDLFLLIPLVALLGLILIGYSPFLSAIGGIVAAILVSWTQPAHRRVGPSAFTEALSQGVLNSLAIGATAGIMGILLASITLTGTTLRASSWIVHLSGGSLVLAMILVWFASYILGMGMTVTAAYILIAIVAAPALVDLGVPVIVAHLVILWFSQDSSFTPPFAIGALVAAGIAGSDPMKTAWKSTWMGKVFYIIPILLVWTPLVITDAGFTFEFAHTFISALLGVIVLSSLSVGYMYRRLRLWEYGYYLVAVVMLLWPSLIVSVVGAALVLVAALMQKRSIKPLVSQTVDQPAGA